MITDRPGAPAASAQRHDVCRTLANAWARAGPEHPHPVHTAREIRARAEGSKGQQGVAPPTIVARLRFVWARPVQILATYGNIDARSLATRDERQDTAGG